MNIGPILEEWLLNGKATYKNLACGGAGLTQIPVPEGKTFIITKIEILPFSNSWNDSNSLIANRSFYDFLQQDLGGFIQRLQYQLLFWNNSVNNTYNIRDKFGINTATKNNDTHTAPSAYFTGHSIDTFTIIETNSWLYLKFLDVIGNPATLYQDSYTNIFNGSQNWNPTNFFGYTDQQDIANIANATGVSYDYVPQGYGTNYGTPDFNTDVFNLPANDITADPNQWTSFIPPLPLTGGSGPFDGVFLPSIPFYNISYIEINRRLSTNGLL